MPRRGSTPPVETARARTRTGTRDRLDRSLRSGGSVTSRVLWTRVWRRVAFASIALTVAVLTGCRAGVRPARLAWARQPAVGRSPTCPEGAVDPSGDGTLPGPLDLRCSYRDALGGNVIQVHGKVFQVAKGPVPTELEGAVVLLRSERDREAKPLSSAVTDAQGGFSMS